MPRALVFVTCSILLSGCSTPLVQKVATTPLPEAVYHTPLAPGELRWLLPTGIQGVDYKIFDSSHRLLESEYSLTIENVSLDGPTRVGNGGELIIQVPPTKPCIVVIKPRGALSESFEFKTTVAKGMEMGELKIRYGDVNSDDKVDQTDIDSIKHFQGHLLSDHSPANSKWNGFNLSDADLNNDRQVDQADLDLAKPNLGHRGSGEFYIPEPQGATKV